MPGNRLAWAAVLVCVVGLTLASAVAQTQADAVSAKTWVGKYEELEEFLKSAEVVEMAPIGTGVTDPQRCELALGGPVDAFAWKPIPPGIYRGFHESYKAEIAAYELDKVLGLEMVPVKVERRIKGDLGAAIMWVAPGQTFQELGGPPTPPATHIEKWNLQVIRAKMFHNLIYDRDPNAGNWLVDPAWNLILIDHSRSFTTEKKMIHEMTRVDRALWEKMKQLDEETLTTALSEWLREEEIRAILDRRDQMEGEINKLVADRGELDVFVP